MFNRSTFLLLISSIVFRLNSQQGAIASLPQVYLPLSCLDFIKQASGGSGAVPSIAISEEGHTVWETPAHPPEIKIREGLAGFADLLSMPTFRHNGLPVLKELHAIIPI